jgi:hypothetical protein
MAVDREADPPTVRSDDVIPACTRQGQELSKQSWTPVDVGELSRGCVAEVQEIDERGPARPGRIPIGDACEPAAFDEEIAVEEITVREPAGHIGQRYLELLGERAYRTRVLGGAGGSHDLRLLDESASLRGRATGGMESHEQVEALGQ